MSTDDLGNPNEDEGTRPDEVGDVDKAYEHGYQQGWAEGEAYGYRFARRELGLEDA